MRFSHPQVTSIFSSFFYWVYMVVPLYLLYQYSGVLDSAPAEREPTEAEKVADETP